MCLQAVATHHVTKQEPQAKPCIQCTQTRNFTAPVQQECAKTQNGATLVVRLQLHSKHITWKKVAKTPAIPEVITSIERRPLHTSLSANKLCFRLHSHLWQSRVVFHRSPARPEVNGHDVPVISPCNTALDPWPVGARGHSKKSGDHHRRKRCQRLCCLAWQSQLAVKNRPN